MVKNVRKSKRKYCNLQTSFGLCMVWIICLYILLAAMEPCTDVLKHSYVSACHLRPSALLLL